MPIHQDFSFYFSLRGKTDLARMLIIYIHGGMYVDVDAIVNPRNFDEVFTPTVKMCLPSFLSTNFAQSLLCSSPGNFLYLRTIREMSSIRMGSSKGDGSDEGGVEYRPPLERREGWASRTGLFSMGPPTYNRVVFRLLFGMSISGGSPDLDLAREGNWTFDDVLDAVDRQAGDLVATGNFVDKCDSFVSRPFEGCKLWSRHTLYRLYGLGGWGNAVDEVWRKAEEKERNATMVPKVIVTYHPDASRLPSKVYKNVGRLAEGWMHLVYDDANATAFLRDNFRPEYAELYESLLSEGKTRADLLMYAHLYKRGGMWLDARAQLRVNADGLLSRPRTVYAVRPDTLSSRSKSGYSELPLLASPSGHPLMLELAERIVAAGVGREGGDDGIRLVTGPSIRNESDAESGAQDIDADVRDDWSYCFLNEVCDDGTSAEIASSGACPRNDDPDVRGSACCIVSDGDGRVVLRSRFADYPFG